MVINHQSVCLPYSKLRLFSKLIFFAGIRKKFFFLSWLFAISFYIFCKLWSLAQWTGFDSQNPKNCCNDTVDFARANDDRQANGADCTQDENYANVANCSQSTKVLKRAWEASSSSLKSKRVRGSQFVDCRSDSSWGFVSEAGRANPCSAESPHCDTLITKNSEKCIGDHMHLEAPISLKLPSTEQCFRIMLMNITDDTKKTQPTKVCDKPMYFLNALVNWWVTS